MGNQPSTSNQGQESQQNQNQQNHGQSSGSGGNNGSVSGSTGVGTGAGAGAGAGPGSGNGNVTSAQNNNSTNINNNNSNINNNNNKTNNSSSVNSSNQSNNNSYNSYSSNSNHPSYYSSHGSANQNQNQAGPNPRRRESIPALFAKATALPPSASLDHASARPHSRGRSVTLATPDHLNLNNNFTSNYNNYNYTTLPASASATGSGTLPPLPNPLNNPLHAIQHSLRSASEEKMGNEQSRQKGGGSHGHGHHHHQLSRDRDRDRDQGQGQGQQVAPPKEKVKAYQQQQLQQHLHQQPPAVPPQSQPPSQPHQIPQRPLQPSPSPQTLPVDVPTAPREDTNATKTDHVSSIGATAASLEYFSPVPSQFSRPPRMPLPIEENVHTPGSPIISPADLKEADLPRPTSVLSSATAEEDEYEEEYQPPGVGDVATVPTLIEWEGPGDRVYVTGTFAGWNRKFRLHRNGPSKKKNVLSAIVNIAPGTHHLSFLVDNDMKTSDKLPTAVDYTNSLVNYLEVSLDDVPQTAAATADESKKPEPAPVQELRAPPGVYPPQVLPPTPELIPMKQPVPEAPKAKVPPATPPRRYHSKIPQYLLDLDASEESSQFERANNAVNSLPTPPSLPMFLSKSILNGSTPMKDDSSVLIIPNHTVLNHLATSSIKDNILATSATTRYKQKFLTTIMYKPKNEDPDREY